jgi:hypothetical protein
MVARLLAGDLATDMVFSDGSSLQVPTITGAVGSDLAGALTVVHAPASGASARPAAARAIIPNIPRRDMLPRSRTSPPRSS